VVSRYLDRHSFITLLRDFSHILPIVCLFHFSPVLIPWLQFPAHPAVPLTTQISHNVHITHTVYGLPHGTCTISDVNPGTTKTTHQYKPCPWRSLLPSTPLPDTFLLCTFTMLGFISRAAPCLAACRPVIIDANEHRQKKTCF